MDPKPTGVRRRGEKLEAALLDAAWQELVASGYTALTFEAVARRAGTSRTVLYRRWATKADLVLAAVRRLVRVGGSEVPDTGSLRGDLIAVMRRSNERGLASNAMIFAYLGGYFRETGTSPKDLRELLIGSRSVTLDVVFGRAIDRGEVDPSTLTPRRRSLAVDLFRHETLMTLAPIPDQVIEEILDDIVLPLVALSRA
jgi:AcrR family transcriptional regulator